MEFKEYKAKTVNDCITAACVDLEVSSENLEYEVIEQGSNGFLGIGSKDAVIKARIKGEEVKESTSSVVKEEKKAEATGAATKKAEVLNADASEIEAKAIEFLKDVFASMKMDVQVSTKYDTALNELCVDLSGDEMGILIGKRGQTLDSLQYLVSLVVNKGTGEYIRVKVDTENYRQRRKDTLENLAKNIASKVKRTRHAVSLEPMNPYERRIIHSALQDDKYVTTHSEGEEPYRHVVVTMKRN